MASKTRRTSARIVVPMKHRRRQRRAPATRMPSARTITLSFAALLAAVGLYTLALKSSLFAVEKVEIRGATPALSRQIDAAVKPFRGRSLVGISKAGVEQAILAIPEVKSAQVDRAFPNTLRVVVAREHPLAVLRRGREAWVIATSGKVVRPLRRGRGQGLPRVWVPASVAVSPGKQLADRGVRTAVKVLATLQGSKHSMRPTSVLAHKSNLTLTLDSGTELRFGDASDAALKLAVSEQILPQLAVPPTGSIDYLDVSVPDRPVGGTELKSNEGQKSGSTASG
ncbi:MAG TPA: FtsQ-type POTRA domain-containing protein [Gaiellaceae bacterium]